MSSNFKFIKTKDDKFRWESDFMILEYSEPSIQAFQEYLPVKNVKDFMYYYYTVKIFKKVEIYDEDYEPIIKEKLVAERSTYDFPCIDELKWILEYQLKNNPIETGQKIEYQNGDIIYREIQCTEGFACDDFYELSKSTNDKGKDETYIFYVGLTYDVQGNLTSEGIRTPYVDRSDLEELLKCVNAFIEYTIDKNNKELEKLSNSFKIKGNKLYEYNDIENEKIESIHVIGDIFYNITYIKNNEQIEVSNVVITDIEDNYIIVDNNLKINIKDI